MPKETAIPDESTYEVVRIGSWAEFQSVLREASYKSWAFSGQADAQRPL